jgi:hypothetical protein
MHILLFLCDTLKNNNMRHAVETGLPQAGRSSRRPKQADRQAPTRFAIVMVIWVRYLSDGYRYGDNFLFMDDTCT